MWHRSLLSLIGLCFGTTLFSQSLEGRWQGYLYNDTTQQFLSFELVLAGSSGKSSGHTRTVFPTNTKNEVGVRTVNGRWRKDRFVLEDGEIIFHTFQEPPLKGVRKLMVLELLQTDTGRVLSGRWITNRTRQYASATGTVQLRELRPNEPPLALTNLLDSLQQASVAKEKPKEIKTTPTKQPNPIVEVAKKPIAVVAKPAEPVQPAAERFARQTRATEAVLFYSDSLELTLYDNGEVDGDTVSVVLNDQILFAKQRLSIQPATRIVPITPQMPDTLQLVMYAENLGSIPPNTGLLILRDGQQRHELRFSADLKTNAVITLIRQRKRKSP